MTGSQIVKPKKDREAQKAAAKEEVQESAKTAREINEAEKKKEAREAREAASTELTEEAKSQTKKEKKKLKKSKAAKKAKKAAEKPAEESEKSEEETAPKGPFRVLVKTSSDVDSNSQGSQSDADLQTAAKKEACEDWLKQCHSDFDVNACMRLGRLRNASTRLAVEVLCKQVGLSL